MYGHIIWDFNGTILDDVDTGIASVNKLLSDRGLPTVKDKAAYREVFGFPIVDYYRRLGFDFNVEPYEVIAPLWVEQYMINVRMAPIFPDVEMAMTFFKDKGIPQTLLSATEREMLCGQLNDLGLTDVFCEILGREDIHAASKEGIAKKWREAHLGENVLMIGDTDHDLQVAKAIGADCALICRGHQSAEYLRGLGASVYNSLSELIEAIK